MKCIQIIFVTIISITFSLHSLFAGCFPRDDVYVENIAQESTCIFAQDIPFCGGELMILFKNNCKDTLVHKRTNTELQNGDDYETFDIPQSEGDTWDEIFYYKNNPDKKIVLSLEVKGKNELLSNINEKTKNIVKKVGINPWWYVISLFFMAILSAIFLLKK